MLLEIALLPPAVQYAIKNGEQITFVENGQPIEPVKKKINDGDYDIAEMDKAINAPSVVVPKFKTALELKHWLDNLTDKDFA